ncbi:MAG: adenylate/guanylate cyclase domain-containing protein [Mariprofundales bacterium]
MKKFARIPIWCSLGMLVLSLFLLVNNPPFLIVLNNLSLDTIQRWQPRVIQQDAPVRIVDIDDKSLQEYGQWPWPRTRIAELIDKLHAMHAAVIVLDIVFAEADRTSLPIIAKQFSQNNPKLAAILAQQIDHDDVLAASIANANIVTGITTTNSRKDDIIYQQKAHYITIGTPALPILPSATAAVHNLPQFEQAAAGNGVFNFISDYDGVIRHVPLLFSIAGQMYPALVIEALRIQQQASNIIVRAHLNDNITYIESIKIGNITIPTDNNAQIWPYFSPYDSKRYVPAWQVIEGSANNDDIAGNIVFIGASAEGLMDLRHSPLGSIIGVEVHAQMAEQILQQNLIKPLPYQAALEFIFFILACIALLFIYNYYGVRWSLLLLISLVSSIISSSIIAFSQYHIFIDPLFPVLVLLAIYLAYFIPRHLLDEAERRWIHNAFSSYVSPNLVQHLEEHPDELNLGGEYRECSFVMTDLAGFTTFMEQTKPQDAVELLNDYLEGMVQISFRHGGTLDRFVGDAVAIIFSAPIAQQDHPARAVACALEMDVFAQRFANEQQQKGLPFGHTRIGVHSGSVLVGNFGGRTMLDYRALGDPINTAARLESVNKHLGTRLCISGYTAAQTPLFHGRPVGVLVLKGKSEGLEVFEPVTTEQKNTLVFQEYMAAYTLLAEERTDTAKTAFAELCQNFPDDPLANFHYQRLLAGESGCHIIMKSK